MNTVSVLLSTYNGGKYLEEQLQSLFNQKDVDIKIYVRDDGSTDNTTNILDSYAKKGLLNWYTGENIGPARSFLELLTKTEVCDYYAFCDQDDVWDPDKLSIAINTIKEADRPALYCSNTLLVTSDLTEINCSNYHVIGSFAESLVSNPMTGCTSVFNNSLRQLAIQYIPTNIDMHDWWIYRICMAFDGFFYFDKLSHIKYRQHGNNVIGGVFSKKKEFIHHIQLLIHHEEGIRYKMLKELNVYYPEMPEHNRKILTLFLNYRKSLFDKIKLLKLIIKHPFDYRIRKKTVIAVLLNKY